MIEKISITALLASMLLIRTSNILFYAFKTVELLIFIYSTKYIRRNKLWYWLFVNLAVYSMDIVLLSNNLLLILIAWEALGICSWALISMKSKKKARRAFLIILLSDSFFIVSIAYLISNSISIYEAPEIIKVLLLIGLFGKSAQIPFSLWLLDAMEAPSTVSALLHSSTMVKAGVVLAYRFLLSSPLCILVGYISALISAIFAIFEKNVKRILALSTIYNLGILFILIGFKRYDLFIYYTISHAFAKAGLFLFQPLLRRKNIYLSKYPKDLNKIILIPFFLFLSGIYPFGKEFLLEYSFIFLPIIVLGTLYSLRFFSIIFSRKEHYKKFPIEIKAPIIALSLLLVMTIKPRFPNIFDSIPILMLPAWKILRREYEIEIRAPKIRIRKVDKLDIQISFLIYLLIAWLVWLL